MAELSALDSVLRNASRVRLSEIGSYGATSVDLSPSDDLFAALAVKSLSGTVCACAGQVRFEFLDARDEPLTEVVLHHGVALYWREWGSLAELADGEVLVRWLIERGISADGHDADVRPERLDWLQAVPPALDELTDQMLGHFKRTRDSSLVAKARKLLLDIDPVTRVLQLLAWCASGTGGTPGHPPYEDMPGLILSHVPITEIAAALEDPRAGERHFAGAARHLLGGQTREKQRMDMARLPQPARTRVAEASRGRAYEIPQWAERFLSA